MIVKVINALLKITYSYVFAGVFNFWLGVFFLYFRDGYLDIDLINSTTFVSTVFLWPISSFATARQLFGQEGSNIWNLFSLSTAFLFFATIIYLFKKEFPKMGNQVENSEDF